MDISTLSLAQLKDLLNLIPSEIKKREKAEKANVLNELNALAAAKGFTLEELIGSGAPTKEKKERAPVAIKYQHPQNNELTWTGRGRQPKWIIEFINAGGALDQLAV